MVSTCLRADRRNPLRDAGFAAFLAATLRGMESRTGTTATPSSPDARSRRGTGAPRRRGRAELGALPNLIVIGAQKCGTSGLHYYLSLHPETSMSKPKELNFFIAERNFPRGLDWYRRALRRARHGAGRVVAQLHGLPAACRGPRAHARTVPDAKLLYMVRDPIDRIAAHWIHNFAKRREKGDLRATLMHPNASYLTRSHY